MENKQKTSDKALSEPLQQTDVSGSVFEKYELEYIDHLVDTDFDLNHETFSKSKKEFDLLKSTTMFNT